MKTPDKLLVISLSGGGCVTVRIKFAQVPATEDAITKAIAEAGQMPPHLSKMIHLHNTDDDLPLMNCNARAILGWVWHDYRDDPREQVVKILEQAAEKENEGDEWKKGDAN